MEHQNKLIYGGILAISALTGCTEPVTEKPLNIVYIMTDDHTAQMMSCYDKRYMDTPNLNRNNRILICPYHKISVSLQKTIYK